MHDLVFQPLVLVLDVRKNLILRDVARIRMMEPSALPTHQSSEVLANGKAEDRANFVQSRSLRRSCGAPKFVSNIFVTFQNLNKMSSRIVSLLFMETHPVLLFTLVLLLICLVRTT